MECVRGIERETHIECVSVRDRQSVIRFTDKYREEEIEVEIEEILRMTPEG